ncbi:MAG: glycosyltransferase family 4 protein [Armatimonadetes bacterium]|nr:glycosyltransferase family 4 protein [Armatimonadota bacterium]
MNYSPQVGVRSSTTVDLSRLSVCFLAGTLGQGGAERQLFYIVQCLRQQGARVQVLCLSQGEYYEAPIRALGVPVRWVGSHHSRLVRALTIIRALRGQDVDVVQSQHFYMNLYATLAARALGARELGAIRCDANTEVQLSGPVLGRCGLRFPRRIAANSQAAIQNAVALGARASRFHLLRNVVDTRQFHPADTPPGNRVRLLVVARLAPQKRVDRFLQALAAVRQEYAAVEGTILGDGPLRKELEQLAGQLGLGDAVRFAGPVANVARHLHDTDVLVLSSDWEGTPNAILEAMASGVPVVATRVGGVPDLVQEGRTGYLVEPSDCGPLAEALLRLAQDAELRRAMGRQARQYVEECHSLERLPVILSDLYREVLA